MLQGEYSRRLYGASHRVDVEALHLVYLDLVPGHLRSIARSLGVCGLTSGSDSGIATPQYWAGGRAPSYRCKSDGQLGCVRPCRFSPPYGSPQRASRLTANDALLYASMSGGMDPDDSAWLMPALSTPFTPVPPQTWVEVSHCPRWDARSKSTAALRTAGWSKMWFYVAPGSGLSVDTGRTVVIDEAAALATRHFGADQQCAGSEHCWGGRVGGNPKSVLSDTLPSLKEDGDASPLVRYVRHELGLSDADIAGLDSIQRLGHFETSCTQRRFELILFTDGAAIHEGTTNLEAAEALPSRIKCGRHPHLVACTPQSPGIRYMSPCRGYGSALYSGDVQRSIC